MMDGIEYGGHINKLKTKTRSTNGLLNNFLISRQQTTKDEGNSNYHLTKVSNNPLVEREATESMVKSKSHINKYVNFKKQDKQAFAGYDDIASVRDKTTNRKEEATGVVGVGGGERNKREGEDDYANQSSDENNSQGNNKNKMKVYNGKGKMKSRQIQAASSSKPGSKFITAQFGQQPSGGATSSIKGLQGPASLVNNDVAAAQALLISEEDEDYSKQTLSLL